MPHTVSSQIFFPSPPLLLSYQLSPASYLHILISTSSYRLTTSLENRNFAQLSIFKTDAQGMTHPPIPRLTGHLHRSANWRNYCRNSEERKSPLMSPFLITCAPGRLSLPFCREIVFLNNAQGFSLLIIRCHRKQVSRNRLEEAEFRGS